MISVVTDIKSARLDYVLDFLFNGLLSTGYRYVDEDKIDVNDPHIYYKDGKFDSEIHFTPHPIIHENSGFKRDWVEYLAIASSELITGERELSEVDIFGIIFCQLSRYEEYLDFGGDEWQRFTSQDSVFNKWVPRLPIIDWIAHRLKEIINEKHPDYIIVETTSHRLISTIDVDQAWAYKYKGWRIILSFGKALVKFDFNKIGRQFRVINGKEPDPFFTYEYIESLHKKSGLDPIIFILMANKLTKADRNHPPSNKYFSDLIRQLSGKYSLGIHPSYHSRLNVNTLADEKKRLSEVVQKEITASRQHFLLLKFPSTYRNLIKIGIKDDYTMGFADTTGYRAGTGRCFKWYDIENEQVTELVIHPFQVMDVTLKRYLGLSPAQAKQRLDSIKLVTQKYSIPLTILWHNSSLDEEGEWRGWREVYEYVLGVKSENKG